MFLLFFQHSVNIGGAFRRAKRNRNELVKFIIFALLGNHFVLRLSSLPFHQARKSCERTTYWLTKNDVPHNRIFSFIGPRYELISTTLWTCVSINKPRASLSAIWGVDAVEIKLRQMKIILQLSPVWLFLTAKLINLKPFNYVILNRLLIFYRSMLIAAQKRVIMICRRIAIICFHVYRHS